MPTDEPVVLTTQNEGVLHLVLNRPDKLNAANVAMQREVVTILERAATDPHVKAVVISGAGRALTAGGDREVLDDILEANRTGTAGSFADVTGEIMRGLQYVTLERARQPIIVAVHGFAIGWGAGLVALADLAVIEEDAYIQEPHSTYGLPPDPSVELVWSRFVPAPVLKQFLLLGLRMSAQEALQWGIVNAVVPRGQAVQAALELARKVAEVPASSAPAIKAGVNRHAVAELPERWPDTPERRPEPD